VSNIVKAIHFCVLGMFLALSSVADETLEVKPEPEVIIETVTSKLMDIATTKSELLASDPKAYFSEVNAVLDPVVDFVSIAKSVMGKKYWLSVTPEQQSEFVTAFQSSLVETYGKGMATFADLDIKVESSRPSEKTNKTYYVVQSVKTKDGVNKVVYTLSQKEAGWKLRNVVLNGVNLGKTFRSQFAQSVRDNGNDVAMAIKKWGVSDS